ncbi:MAG: hypothetical protein M1561_00795 [Gammaproteobacteria bacterium]|nr:hypothetical protein [Gammaproteobacteria bacterium]
MQNLSKFKKILGCVFIGLIFGLLIGCSDHKDYKRIAIIIPMEHEAFHEMIAGFENTLRKNYSREIKFKVFNAQGDINLERAIIAEARDEKYDLLVPISTATSEMTMALVKKIPIVALAAEISAQDRARNVAIVDDEINKAQILDFIRAANPGLKNLTLVHSTADKIFTEVAEVKKAALKSGINLHEMLVQNLTDLYGAANAISTDTQAIYILKDSLIASGIDTLIQVANLRHIALITSDDGTVKHGASYALGVSENQIGEEGAKLAAKILCGAEVAGLAIVKLTLPTVFINSTAFSKQAVAFAAVKQAAEKLHYPLKNTGGK